MTINSKHFLPTRFSNDFKVNFFFFLQLSIYNQKNIIIYINTNTVLLPVGRCPVLGLKNEKENIDFAKEYRYNSYFDYLSSIKRYSNYNSCMSKKYPGRNFGIYKIYQGLNLRMYIKIL